MGFFVLRPFTSGHKKIADWRILILTPGSSGSAIGEFEIRTSTDGPNVLVGGTGIASPGSTSASYAFDGSLSSYTSLGTGAGKWLAYNIPVPIALEEISELVMATSNAGLNYNPLEYAFQYSPDGGSTWVTLKTQTLGATYPFNVCKFVTTVSNHTQLDVARLRNGNGTPLSFGNLRMTGVNFAIIANQPCNDNRRYMEMTLENKDSNGSAWVSFGFARPAINTSYVGQPPVSGQAGDGWGYAAVSSYTTGGPIHGNAPGTPGFRNQLPVLNAGDVMGIVWDVPSNLSYVFINNVFWGLFFDNLEPGLYAAVTSGGTNQVLLNFGSMPFAYPIPMGAIPYDSNNAIAQTSDTNEYEYWRLKILTADSGTGCYITSLRLLSDTGTDLWVGGIPTCDNNNSFTQSGNNGPVTNAFDGNPATYWGTSYVGYGPARYMIYRLPAGIVLDKNHLGSMVVETLNTSGAKPDSYELAWSADAFVWNTISSGNIPYSGKVGTVTL